MARGRHVQREMVRVAGDFPHARHLLTSVEELRAQRIARDHKMLLPLWRMWLLVHLWTSSRSCWCDPMGADRPAATRSARRWLESDTEVLRPEGW